MNVQARYRMASVAFPILASVRQHIGDEMRKTKTALAARPKTRLKTLAFLLMTAPAALPLSAQVIATPAPAAAAAQGQKSYAQELVDRTLARHPDLLDIELHAARPGAAESTIVAGKRPERIGRKSREFEVAVARTGTGFVEINKTGDQNVEVQIPLLDA